MMIRFFTVIIKRLSSFYTVFLVVNGKETGRKSPVGEELG